MKAKWMSAALAAAMEGMPDVVSIWGQPSFLSEVLDAGAMNLFTNGQDAMFYMGRWEASMALNEDIPEEIRTNIRVFTMPVVEGGAVSATDIAAWNGGGYGVSANSELKEEAIKLTRCAT